MQKHISLKILPFFIICGVLMLSIKINNVFDSMKSPTNSRFSISYNHAISKEEAETKSDAVITPPSVLPNIKEPQDNFTKVEIEILQDLASRRELLEEKSKAVDKRSFQLQLAQEEIDKKIAQMKDYEEKLSKLVSQYNKQEQEKINNLIKMYSTMKPKDAARIFDTLDMDILTRLLSEMKPSTSSAIMAQMNPNIAKSVTTELIGNNIAKKK